MKKVASLIILFMSNTLTLSSHAQTCPIKTDERFGTVGGSDATTDGSMPDFLWHRRYNEERLDANPSHTRRMYNIGKLNDEERLASGSMTTEDWCPDGGKDVKACFSRNYEPVDQRRVYDNIIEYDKNGIRQIISLYNSGNAENYNGSTPLHFAIGNEPNFFPYVHPEVYAEVFKKYYDYIKGPIPNGLNCQSCVLHNGGILTISVMQELYSVLLGSIPDPTGGLLTKIFDVEYKIKQAGVDPQKYIGYITWTRRFLNELGRIGGKVDIFNAHIYELNSSGVDVDPILELRRFAAVVKGGAYRYKLTGLAQGVYFCADDNTLVNSLGQFITDIEPDNPCEFGTQKIIVGNEEYQTGVLTRYHNPNPEIWIDEFGVLSPNVDAQYVIDVMNDQVSFMKANSTVATKWFWYKNEGVDVNFQYVDTFLDKTCRTWSNSTCDASNDFCTWILNGGCNLVFDPPNIESPPVSLYESGSLTPVGRAYACLQDGPVISVPSDRPTLDLAIQTANDGEQFSIENGTPALSGDIISDRNIIISFGEDAGLSLNGHSIELTAGRFVISNDPDKRKMYFSDGGVFVRASDGRARAVYPTIEEAVNSAQSDESIIVTSHQYQISSPGEIPAGGAQNITLHIDPFTQIILDPTTDNGIYLNNTGRILPEAGVRIAPFIVLINAHQSIDAAHNKIGFFPNLRKALEISEPGQTTQLGPGRYPVTHLVASDEAVIGRLSSKLEERTIIDIGTPLNFSTDLPLAFSNDLGILFKDLQFHVNLPDLDPDFPIFDLFTSPGGQNASRFENCVFVNVNTLQPRRGVALKVRYPDGQFTMKNCLFKNFNVALHVETPTDPANSPILEANIFDGNQIGVRSQAGNTFANLRCNAFFQNSTTSLATDVAQFNSEAEINSASQGGNLVRSPYFVDEGMLDFRLQPETPTPISDLCRFDRYGILCRGIKLPNPLIGACDGKDIGPQFEVFTSVCFRPECRISISIPQSTPVACDFLDLPGSIEIETPFSKIFCFERSWPPFITSLPIMQIPTLPPKLPIEFEFLDRKLTPAYAANAEVVNVFGNGYPFMRIRQDEFGSEIQSSLSQSTLPDFTPPAAVTAFSAQNTPQGASLQWSSTLDGSVTGSSTTGLARYKIIRQNSPPVQVASLGPEATTFLDTGALLGAVYHILAYDSTGNQSTPTLSYIAWQPDQSYVVGNRVLYNGIVYEAILIHTSQAGMEPPNAPALWAHFLPEGTLEQLDIVSTLPLPLASPLDLQFSVTGVGEVEFILHKPSGTTVTHQQLYDPGIHDYQFSGVNLNEFGMWTLEAKFRVWDVDAVHPVPVTIVSKPFQVVFPLSIRMKDNGLSETNISKPQLYLQNASPSLTLSNFTVRLWLSRQEMPFQDIVADPYYFNPSGVQLSVGSSQANPNLVFVDLKYPSGFSVAPGAITATDGAQLGLHFRNYYPGQWNRTNDWSWLGITNTFSGTPRVTVYDVTGKLLYGEEPSPGSLPQPPQVSMPDLFGFEKLFAWGSEQAALSLSTNRTQGVASLQVQGGGYLVIAALPRQTQGITGETSRLALDLYIPGSQPNPYWVGAAQLYVDCFSAGIYNTFLGNVELTGLPQNRFSTLRFNVPASVLTALQGSHSDFTFKIVLNINSGTLPFRLDNLRFVP